MNLEQISIIDIASAHTEVLREIVSWTRCNRPSGCDSAVKAVVRALQDIAIRRHEERRDDEALEAIEAALVWSADDVVWKSVLYPTMGTILLELRQFERSIDVQKRALEAARSFPAPLVLRATIAFNLGNTLRIVGRLDEAVAALQIAVDSISHRSGESPEMGGSDFIVSKESMSLETLQAKIELELGAIEVVRGDFEKALPLFKQVLESSFGRNAERYLEAGKGIIESNNALEQYDASEAMAHHLMDTYLEPSLRNPNSDVRFHIRELTEVCGALLEILLKRKKQKEARSILARTLLLAEKCALKDQETLANYRVWHGMWAERADLQEESMVMYQKALDSIRRFEPLMPSLEKDVTLSLFSGLIRARRLDDAEELIRAASRRDSIWLLPADKNLLDVGLAQVLTLKGQPRKGCDLAEKSLEYFISHSSGAEKEIADCTIVLMESYQSLGLFEKVLPLMLRTKGVLVAIPTSAATRQVIRINSELRHIYGMQRVVSENRTATDLTLIEIEEENRKYRQALVDGDDGMNLIQSLCQGRQLGRAEKLLLEAGEKLTKQKLSSFLRTIVDLADAYQREGSAASAFRVSQYGATRILHFEIVPESGSLLGRLVEEGYTDLARDLAQRMRDEDDFDKAGSEPPWKLHRRLANAFGQARQDGPAIAEIDQAIRNIGNGYQSALLELNIHRRRHFGSLISKALENEDAIRAWQLAEQMVRSEIDLTSLPSDAARFFGARSESASIVCYYSLLTKVLIVSFQPALGEVRTHLVGDGPRLSQALFELYDQVFDELLILIREMNELIWRSRSIPGRSQRTEWNLQNLLRRQKELLRHPLIDKSLGTMHHLLIDPVRQEFASGRIVAVVADSHLTSVPFYALYDTARSSRLIDDGPDLLFLPSLAHISIAPERRKKELSRKGLLVAPDLALLDAQDRDLSNELTSGYEPLNQSGLSEVAAVRSFGDVKVLMDDSATLTNISTEISDVGFVHFLSHGMTNFEDPRRAGLSLSGGDTLRGDFLENRRLEFLWMIVLGSCYGASSRESTSNNELRSLASDLVKGGVPVVIGSLWFVGSAATARLMSFFYHELGSSVHETPENVNVAGAFRRALLRTRDAFPEVFYWALFCVVGDFCPIQVTSERAGAPFRQRQVKQDTFENDKTVGTNNHGSRLPDNNPRISELEDLARKHMALMSDHDARELLSKSGAPTQWAARFMAIMREILDLDPQNPSALSNIADMGHRIGFTEEACHAAEKLVKCNPNGKSYAVLGSCLIVAERFDEAIEAMEKAQSLGESNFHL